MEVPEEPFCWFFTFSLRKFRELPGGWIESSVTAEGAMVDAEVRTSIATLRVVLIGVGPGL